LRRLDKMDWVAGLFFEHVFMFFSAFLGLLGLCTLFLGVWGVLRNSLMGWKW